jgi:hypothetical protein
MTDLDTMTLKEASERYRFPMATLRAEIGRGRLVVYKIGKRFYTTPDDIRAMVQECRVANLHRASTSTRDEANGSSATDRLSSARAALSQTVERLKSSSLATSAKSTRQRRGATR